jgi:AraC-like DNA-binding protein
MGHSRLDRVHNWEERIKHAGYKVSRVARNLTVSPRHLRRYLENNFGKAPHEWFNGLLMRDAAQLLREGKSVKETAAALGVSASHLSHAFKKAFGFPPSSAS